MSNHAQSHHKNTISISWNMGNDFYYEFPIQYIMHLRDIANGSRTFELNLGLLSHRAGIPLARVIGG
jgi:hypothetical protein